MGFLWVLSFSCLWLGYPGLWYPIVAPKSVEELDTPIEAFLVVRAWTFFSKAGFLALWVLVLFQGVRVSAPTGCSPRGLDGMFSFLQGLLLT